MIKLTPKSKKKGLSLPPTSNPDDNLGTATAQFFTPPPLDDVEDTVIDLGKKAGDAISDAGEAVSDVVEEGSNLLGDVVDETATEAGETVNRLQDGANNMIDRHRPRSTDTVEVENPYVADAAEQIDRLRDGATNVIDKTNDLIRETGNEVEGQVDELATGARETFDNLRDGGNDQIDRWQDNTNDVVDRFQEDQLGHRRGGADEGQVNDTANEGGFNLPHIPAERVVDTANQGVPMIEADILVDHPLIGGGEDQVNDTANHGVPMIEADILVDHPVDGFDLPFIDAYPVIDDDTIIQVPPSPPPVDDNDEEEDEDHYHDGHCYDDFFNAWEYFFPIVCQPRPVVIVRETVVIAPPVETVFDSAPLVDSQDDLEIQEDLPQVPVGATLELVGQDLGAEMGEVHLNIGPISLKAEVIDWNEMVVVTLPNFALAQPTLAQLVMVRANGEIDTIVDIELVAAEVVDQE